MHTILSTQLEALHFTDDVKHLIQPLSLILESITKAGLEDEGDPLTSTFEALRAMQTTISQFNPNSGGENSESSSEYTTPAQSQTTSPSHEQSPPPPGSSMLMATATVGSAAKLLTMQNNGAENSSSSPTTSPTHCERVSSLATHSHHASKSYSHSRYRSSHSGVENSGIVLDVPVSPRRKSDSELQKHRVRPASQQLPSVGDANSHSSNRHSHSRSIDYSASVK